MPKRKGDPFTPSDEYREFEAWLLEVKSRIDILYNKRREKIPLDDNDDAFVSALAEIHYRGIINTEHQETLA